MKADLACGANRAAAASSKPTISHFMGLPENDSNDDGHQNCACLQQKLICGHQYLSLSCVVCGSQSLPDEVSARMMPLEQTEYQARTHMQHFGELPPSVCDSGTCVKGRRQPCGTCSSRHCLHQHVAGTVCPQLTGVLAKPQCFYMPPETPNDQIVGKKH